MCSLFTGKFTFVHTAIQNVKHNECTLLAMAKGETGHRIRAAMEAKRLKPKELAHKVGVSVQALSNYFSGYREVSGELLPKFAETLDVTTDWLLSGRQSVVQFVSAEATTESLPRTVPKPYWGLVPAGNWQMPNTEEGSMIEVSSTLADEDVVVVVVAGNSLEPRLRHGQKVAIKRSTQPIDGVITLAVNQDNDFTLKVLSHRNGAWVLHAINPNEPELEPVESWRILGHAVHFEETDPNGLRA